MRTKETTTVWSVAHGRKLLSLNMLGSEEELKREISLRMTTRKEIKGSYGKRTNKKVCKHARSLYKKLLIRNSVLRSSKS